jgi:hypothetical protein
MVGGVGDRPPHTGAPLRGDIIACAHFFGVVTLDLHPPLEIACHTSTRAWPTALLCVRVCGVWVVVGQCPTVRS